MPLSVARSIDVANYVVAEVNGLSAGLSYTAKRVWSFGFTDSDLGAIQVPVRPIDLAWDDESRGTEGDEYELQVGVLKMVSRLDVAYMDSLWSLMVTIANTYPLGRKITIGSGSVEVIEKRPFPALWRSDKILDSTDPQTRFFSSLMVKFREVVERG